jgi:hypothetical protein
MHPTKFLAMALATAVTAVPCHPCPQQLTASNTTLSNRTNATNLNHFIFSETALHESSHEAEMRLLSRRKTWEEAVHMYDWRDWTWPPKQRDRWSVLLRAAFNEVVMPHLPGNFELPSPLLPTKNQTLQELYKRAVTEATLEGLKPPGQKRSEFAKLKRMSKQFMEAVPCAWGWDHDHCWRGPEWSKKTHQSWYRAYTNQKAEIMKLTETEGLVRLGEDLRALGFPESQVH